MRALGIGTRRDGLGDLSAGGLKQRGSSGGEGREMAAVRQKRDGGGQAAGQEAKANTNGGRNSFFAGGLAGSISTTITCPIEVGPVSDAWVLAGGRGDCAFV